jgi:PAS domain S-box-containing protein
MATMLGYGVEEMTGKSLLDFMDDETRLAAASDLEQRHRGIGGQHERRFQNKDGKTLWMHVSATPLFGREGQYTGAIAMLTDITERKRLEEQFRQAQKMEAVGRLAGGVAHDFNNLLMVINGHCDLLLKKLDARDPMHGQLTAVRKAGQRATALTQQLLAFSRKQITQPRVLDLNQVVGDVENMLRRLIGEDIALVTVLSPELGRVRTDPGHISQALMNLAVNSRDAMPKGGRLMIETANIDLDETYAREHPAVNPGPYVQLTVSDSGTGMDAETQAHLFEPFFTTKKTGEGTGLGLSTVHGIVEQAGGFIWVYSELAKGTTFKIYLPRVEEAVEVEDVAEPAAGTLQGTETILVVEDQPELRKLARMVLEDHGYKVLAADNARDALFLSERHAGPIHLMLTDVVMPGMNGRELADRLKPLRPEMKVVYMSGYTANAIVEHGVLEPGIEYLQKPVSPDALAAKVRGMLGPPRAAGTVLVVDDEAGIRGLVRGILQSAGYEVLEAEDGQQAMKQAERPGVDLVITDVVMPEQEGIETIQLLRKRRPNLKIIVMSGAAMGGVYLDMAKKLGAHAVLAKPVQPDQLLETVRRILSE